MASKTDIDQDALAAEWGLALDGNAPAQPPSEPAAAPAEAAAPAGDKAASAADGNDEMAAEWAAMIDDGSQFVQAAKGGAERILNQEEIDGLLGFSLGEINLNDNSGIRAIIDSAMVSYERLPMLDIVFDRLVRLMTTSLRNFTSDNVEVSLDRITSVRFGDYLNLIPLPAILAVFKADAGEGRHHHQDRRRERQHGNERDQLDHALGEARALAEIDADVLGGGRMRRRHEHRRGRREAAGEQRRAGHQGLSAGRPSRLAISSSRLSNTDFDCGGLVAAGGSGGGGGSGAGGIGAGAVAKGGSMAGGGAASAMGAGAGAGRGGAGRGGGGLGSTGGAARGCAGRGAGGGAGRGIGSRGATGRGGGSARASGA
jgi:Flagellar motor switch protein FliM